MTMCRILFTLTVFAIVGCSGPIGEDFRDVDSIGKSETWKDWVVVGRFGPEGPFELAEFKECEYSEACSFSHNGQSHTSNCNSSRRSSSWGRARSWPWVILSTRTEKSLRRDSAEKTYSTMRHPCFFNCSAIKIPW